MIFLAALMIGLGMAGILKKRTILGFVISFQFLMLGCLQLFLAPGGAKGYLIGLMIVVCSSLYSVAMLALSIRLHYLKPGAKLADLRSLRR